MSHCAAEAALTERLAAENTRLGFAFSISDNTMAADLMIVTEKVDKKRRGSPVAVLALYCPFCGQLRENRHD